MTCLCYIIDEGETEMNIIFLDVDGVLNSINKLIEVYNKTKEPHSGYSYPFDEKCIENLQRLVRETNSKLVITSTWRKDKEGIETLLNELKKYGLDKEIIGYTPILLNKKRGREIKEYLSTLKDIPNFIILDDDTDMEELLPFLIKTNIQTGLTYENMQEAINKLNVSKIKKDEEIDR